MDLFQKRETLISNITYMAIMASINVIFSLLSLFIPGMVFFLFFLLSLSSSLVALFCDRKYYIIYFVVTLAITLPINLADTLFYVLPALVTGLVFGFCFEKKISGISLILLLTIVQMIFTYISIPLIDFFIDRNIVIDMAKICHLENKQYLNYIKHIFIFLISFIQQVIAYVIIYSQIHKLFKNDEIDGIEKYIRYGFALLNLLLSLIFLAFFPEFIYVFTSFTLVVAIYELVNLLIQNKKIIYIELVIGLLISFFLFAAFYSSLDFPYSMLLINIYLFSVLIIGLINNCLLNTLKNHKMK